ncbi:BatD family protein [Winogradskyella sp.]|uniref:BatD family protein n=1 Tax=Winogradskyella sp. TaxID=1883156 RepID=UPI002601BEA6|nr:BatD family protein [Winogradskyella sp.]
MNLTKHILFTVLLLITGSISAQIVFKATVNKSEIGLNEKVQVTFTMSEDNESFKPPVFEYFKVVDSPMTSRQNGFNNGVRSFEKSIIYTLQPKKTGTLVINHATLMVNDKEYQSNRVEVKVKRKRKKDYIINKDSLQDMVFLKLDYPDTSITVKDSIVLSYRLYASKGIGVDSWKTIEDSKFKNAEVRDITPKKLEVITEEMEGMTFRSVILRKVVLKPSKEGRLKISPMKILVSTRIPSGRRDFSTKNIEDIKRIELSSKKATITVD